MEQESKEFEMRERIRQEQMGYEKKQRKLMAEEHRRQELEIMENQRKFEEKLEQGLPQTHQRSSNGAQTTKATNHQI